MIANVFRVYDANLMRDEEFMLGWRMWSFHMTKIGQSTSFLSRDDDMLIQKMKARGKICSIESKRKWNDFRTSMLSVISGINPKMHFHDQYRLIFKKVAFVVVDCCFAAKYRPDNMYQLIRKMFHETNTSEMPSYFILINNDILDSEMEYKITQQGCPQYENTQHGIRSYQNFNPSIYEDGMKKTYVPFAMAHKAMIKAETRAQMKMAMGQQQYVNRASINDYAQLYLIDQLRRSFGQCARVALLSDDNRMIRTASKFVAPVARENVYPNLPPEYLNSYIITPAVLHTDDWNNWRYSNAYDAFSRRSF